MKMTNKLSTLLNDLHIFTKQASFRRCSRIHYIVSPIWHQLISNMTLLTANNNVSASTITKNVHIIPPIYARKVINTSARHDRSNKIPNVLSYQVKFKYRIHYA